MKTPNEIATLLDTAIKERVAEILSERNVPEIPSDFFATDNLGEVIEKLCILHIRTWFLEDMIGVAKTDAEVASLKRKIDICFKKRRPQYIQAINHMIDTSIVSSRSLSENSVKVYKGFDDEQRQEN